jgi:hypothetical protein
MRTISAALISRERRNQIGDYLRWPLRGVPEIEPMDLANMRQHGVRSLDVQRHGCPAIAPMAAAVRPMDALA